MIHQGILVFENTHQGTRLVNRRVAGLSLLERGIRTLARAGIKRLVVVVPEGTHIALSGITRKLDITLECLSWGSTSTISFASGEGFLLLQGDYVHHHSSLSALLEKGLDSCDLVAQVAEHPPQDDVSQVISLSSGSVELIETEAPTSRVSSGAFLCAAALFSPSELTAAPEGLQDFLKARTKDRKTATHECAPLWRRVRDRRSARAAKNMLFDHVTKSTSGFVSRHLNARISIPTSKLLVETGLSPHMVTILFVLTTGLAAAYLMTRADDYVKLATAGLLWQLAAVFDRCDGEIARVRLCESKFGAWFDTVTDNIAYICAYAGLMTGMHRIYPDDIYLMYLGVSAVLALLLYLGLAYRYAARIGSGSLQHYLMDSIHNVPAANKPVVYQLMERYGFIAKRDFFSLFVFIAAVVNYIEAIYWFAVLGLHLLVIGVLLSQKKVIQTYGARQSSEQQSSEQQSAVTVQSGRKL